MKFSFSLLYLLLLFDLSYVLTQKQLRTNIEKIKLRQLEEEKVQWPCSTKGIVTDKNNNPIPKVKISGKLSIMNMDKSLTFYKELPATESDESGNFIIKYEIEDSEDVVTLEENLKFEYTQFGEKQVESRKILINRPNYFGSKDLIVTMKFKGLIEGSIKDSTGSTVFPEAEVKAEVKENGKTATTTSNKKGEFKVKIEVPPNKKSDVIITVKPKNQEKYKEQQFVSELGPDNDYQDLSKKLVMLKEKEIEVKGGVEDMKEKPAKKAYVKIKVGEQIVETETDNEGKFDTIFELSEDNFKKFKSKKNIKSEAISKSGDQLNSQEFTIKNKEKVYLLKMIKLSNKVNYLIKIKKLLDASQKEIRENDVKIKVLVGDSSVILERKTIKGATEKSRFMYYYEGSMEIEKKGKQLKGKIVINGGQYYANQEVIIKENLEKLEKLSLTKEINKITLQEQKKALELKGVVLGSKKNEKIIDAQISVSITCQSCEKKTTIKSTAKTDLKGEFSLKIKDAIELNQKQTIQLIVSSDGYLEKTVSKQFNGKLEELEALKTKEWKIVLASKQFLVIEGTVKDLLSQEVLVKSKIKASIFGEIYETTTNEKGGFEIKQELKKEKLAISVDLTIIPESDEYKEFVETIEIKQKNGYKLVRTFELLKTNAVVFKGIVKQGKGKLIKLVDDASIEITISNPKGEKQKLVGKTAANGKFFIGGILDSKLLKTFPSDKATIRIEKGGYFNIKEVQLKAGQQEYTKDISIIDEVMLLVKVDKITDSEGKEIKDDKINLEIKLTGEKDQKEVKVFSLKRIKKKENFEYEGSIVLKIANEKMDGNLVISGIQDYKKKTIPLTVDLKSKDKTEIINEIKVVILEQKQKLFQLEVKGQIKDSNGNGVSYTDIEIEVINVDDKGKKTPVNNQVEKTDKDGKYDVKININEAMQGDVIIKITLKDKWVEGKSTETKITLDLEKQKKKEVQIIELEPIQVKLKECKSFKLSGKVTGDATGKELEKNMKGIENAQIELKLKENSSGKEKTIKGQTTKEGSYKIEITKWMTQGIEYTAELKVQALHFKEAKEEFTLKPIQETVIQVKDVRLKTKLVTKKFELKGQVKDENNNPSEGVEVIVMKKNGEEWGEIVKGKTNEKGKYDLKGEIVADEDSVVDVKLEIKGDNLQTKEEKLKMDLKQKGDIILNVKTIQMKPAKQTIIIEVKGEAHGTEANEKLQNAEVSVVGTYSDEEEKIQTIKLEGETNNLGEFDLKQSLELKQSTVISCQMVIKKEHYVSKEINFKLNEKNKYKKIFENTIELNYNFMKPDGFQTITGVIQRKEQCGKQLVNHPVSDFLLKLYLKNYYKKPLLYKTLRTNKDGTFEIKAPIFSHVNYNAKLYYPYQTIEGNEKDAYVSSSNSFDIFYKNKGKQIDLGIIQVPNRRDTPFECSSPIE